MSERVDRRTAERVAAAAEFRSPGMKRQKATNCKVCAAEDVNTNTCHDCGVDVGGDQRAAIHAD